MFEPTLRRRDKTKETDRLCETYPAMKTPYSFVTLRYVHDVVTGEFANVGVVLYAPEQRLLLARFTGSHERLGAIFLKIDHAHFCALMHYLTIHFEELGEDLRDSLEQRPTGEIEQVVRQVLPPDDSSLQWSEPGGGFTENAEETLRHLYSRLVERYVLDSEPPSRTASTDKVKLWFDREGDYLEVTFSDAPGCMRETKCDAVMQRVDEQGRVIGFSVLGVSKFQKDHPLEAELAAGA